MKGKMMSRASLLVRTCFAAAVALIMGCAKGNSGAVAVNNLGQHPADWVQTHWVSFNQNKEACTVCHGSYSVQAQSGGTSGVTCFQCHHSNGPLHPATWPDPAQHGATAKLAPSLTGGFSHCAACHGSLYSEPLTKPGGQTYSCFTCHSRAPHPDKPWHGTTASGTSHASVNAANAPECAKCHLNGQNLDPNDLAFHGTAPAGTAPGCFNNTMCHGDNPGHVANWGLAANHGRLGAQAAPSSTSATAPKGFSSCLACHGANYTGGASGTGTSCYACHTKAPHPDKADWASGTTITQPSHIYTDPGNASECARCHTNGANSDQVPTSAAPAGTAPGCFNNTLCHDRTIVNN
jgi:hypothetical protein